MKVELAVMKGALECLVELAAKDATEHLDGKKEGVAWLDPTPAVGRESTGRHDAMHIRVELEFLTPGVQHAEETDFSAEVFGIAGDFDKGLRTAKNSRKDSRSGIEPLQGVAAVISWITSSQLTNAT
jgi:hypothetical protein